jgi:uncharacterized integral membrane protein
MSNSSSTSGGISFGSALFLVLLVLKLTNTIDWSWWWVFSPFWMPLVIVMAFAGVIGFVGLISKVVGVFSRKRAVERMYRNL